MTRCSINQLVWPWKSLNSVMKECLSLILFLRTMVTWYEVQSKHIIHLTVHITLQSYKNKGTYLYSPLQYFDTVVLLLLLMCLRPLCTLSRIMMYVYYGQYFISVMHWLSSHCWHCLANTYRYVQLLSIQLTVKMHALKLIPYKTLL